MRVTAVLTVWEHSPPRRQLRQVLEGLYMQNEPLEVLVWDNGYPVTSALPLNTIRAPRDLGLATHQLASLVDSEYILKIDDDVIITDPDFVSNGIAALERHSLDIAGVMGREFPPEPPYYVGRSAVKSIPANVIVDIVIGKVMLYRRSILSRVSVERDREEDLQLCRASRKPCLIPAAWGGAYRDVPKAPGAAMSDARDHYQRREQYVREHWNELRKLRGQV